MDYIKDFLLGLAQKCVDFINRLVTLDFPDDNQGLKKR